MSEIIQRNRVLSPTDLCVYHLIKSYPNGLHCETLAQIGEKMQRSNKTAQRSIRKLVKLKLIKKRYGIFKKLILTLTDCDHRLIINKANQSFI